MTMAPLSTITTVEELFAQFDAVVAWATDSQQRIGYFAAVHRNTVHAIYDAIEQGEFQNADRMQRLLVTFGSRFLDAVAHWRAGGTPSRSWVLAFGVSGDAELIILQHLLVAFNAHIRLDLGIAAATVAPGAEIADLGADFVTVNNVLDTLVDISRLDTDKLSPCIREIDRLGLLDDDLVELVLKDVREHAWSFAERLASAPAAQWPPLIAERDAWVAEFAAPVLKPEWLIADLLRDVVLPAENHEVDEVISTLSVTNAGAPQSRAGDPQTGKPTTPKAGRAGKKGGKPKGERVLIVGGGVGGLTAAARARRTRVRR